MAAVVPVEPVEAQEADSPPLPTAAAIPPEAHRIEEGTEEEAGAMHLTRRGAALSWLDFTGISNNV